jgi:hypothetical protein
MIYHVLPGDAQLPEFRKAGIDGEVIVCRECLAVGDVNAAGLSEFWDQRARFLLAEYGEDEIEYHDKVAGELASLLDADEGDEVNLWFEYELFCSVNYWFCLYLLSETPANVYRVEPYQLKHEDRWDGFGEFDAADLLDSHAHRIELSRSDIELGRDLWLAFRSDNKERLSTLSTTDSKAFPHLSEVIDAACERDSRPAEIVAEIMFEGRQTIDEVFPEFKSRAGIYGYGDLQVQKLIERHS